MHDLLPKMLAQLRKLWDEQKNRFMYGFCDGYKYAPLAKHNRTTLLKLDTDRQNYNFAANLETLRSGKLFHK